MDASAPKTARRHPSSDKMPFAVGIDMKSPFQRLPDEIIEQILEAADPNGFSSLTLLNRKWRAVSQRSHLYRLQLARCPSFVANSNSLPAAEDRHLPRLRRLLSHEAKRNLFDAYTRPNRTLIKLVSTSFGSSSCLGGETLSFSTSLRGHHILAYNSSRIYLLDARGPGLEVRRELRILRRPTSVCITDDASLLAVFSAEMQVDVYDLKATPPKRKQSIILDSNPRTIALSSCGSVLAAAYEAGIEVMALGTGALPSEKRSVKCDSVDALTFSFDGTQILGMTHQSSPPSTVIVAAPYYDPGALVSDGSLSAMWTTSILFPNSSRDCSHAILLQDGHVEADWAFAYDRSFETFRAVRIDDLRNGTTYFTGPVPRSQAQMLPSTLPSATYRGELVSAAFHGSEVWLYGVPDDPAAVPERDSALLSSPGDGSCLTRGNSSRSTSRPTSTWTQDAAAAAGGSTMGRAPQWQMVCDKVRNHFVAGHKISELSDVTSVKWVSNFGGDRKLRERLVVTARGITRPRPITEEEDFDYVDGGRVLLLDFDYSPRDGTRKEITIELGTGDAEILEEERRDIETEVALARRRTVLQRRGGGAAGGRPGSRSLLSVVTSAQAMAAASEHSNINNINFNNNSSSHNGNDDDDDPLAPRIIGRNPASAHPSDDTSEETSQALFEAEALDAPYAHSSPRSGTTLRRAATAAAVNRRYNPRAADGTPYEYRRADGREEHPHESDADNWVPPPPPYQPDDPGDAPAFMRAPAISVPPMTSPESSGVPSVRTTRQQQQRQDQHQNQDQDMQQTHNVQHDQQQSQEQHRQRHQRLAPSAARDPSATSAAPNSTTIPATVVTPATAAANPSADAHPDRPTAPPSTLTPSIYDVSPPESPESMRHHQPHVPPSPMVLGASPAVPSEPFQPLPEAMSSAMRESTLPILVSTEATSTQTGAASLPFLNPPRLEIRPSSTIPFGEMFSMTELSPRRLSNSLTWPSARSPSPPTSPPRFHVVIDQSLIISTPAGVSGALDPPGRRTSRRGDLPILAPVPQRPQAGGPNSSAPRSAVDRLETIFTAKPAEEEKKPAAAKGTSRLLPKWVVNKVAAAPRRSASLVNRRPSRAGRSAAKNMQDARRRGWRSGAKGQQGKKKEEGQGGGGGEGEGARRGSLMGDGVGGNDWMDVPVTPVVEKLKDRDKRCVVM